MNFHPRNPHFPGRDAHRLFTSVVSIARQARSLSMRTCAIVESKNLPSKNATFAGPAMVPSSATNVGIPVLLTRRPGASELTIMARVCPMRKPNLQSPKRFLTLSNPTVIMTSKHYSTFRTKILHGLGQAGMKTMTLFSKTLDAMLASWRRNQHGIGG